MLENTLTIGSAARRAGVHVETIRYYQRRGLLPRPDPPVHRRIRRYPPALVDKVRFIKRAQQLGFTLADIAQLISLVDRNKCSPVCALAERRRQEVQREIEHLRAVHAALEGLVAACRANAAEAFCPLVLALAELPGEPA